MINTESEIYKKRQAEQELMDSYKKRALDFCNDPNMIIIQNCNLSMNSHPFIQLVENGAYVECVMFISKDEIS